MTRTCILIGVVGSGLLALPAVASANDREDRIKTRIEGRFDQDDRLKDDEVKVEVDGSQVTLKGKVDSAAEKNRAARLAKVAGVARIDNQLEIDAGAPNRTDDDREDRADRIEDRAEHKKDEIDRRTEAAKDQTERKAEADKKAVDRQAREGKERVGEDSHEVGTELGDTWITTKVKTELASADGLKGSDISVDTNRDGEVTLTGTVPSADARKRAVEVAKGVKGVRSVKEKLTVSADRK